MQCNRIYIRLKRKIAFLMAMIFVFQSFFSSELGTMPVQAATEGRGSTFAYYDSSNLLKPGASFPFYGKEHNRVGLWPYGITNVEQGKSAAGFCLEPNKSMRTGTQGTIVSYDLDTEGDNLPLGISREEAEILWYALSSSGNFEGYQDEVGKMGQGHYILGQAATWAIMSGRWAGLEDFQEQMEVLLANLKSQTLANQTRAALEQFFNQTHFVTSSYIPDPGSAKKRRLFGPLHRFPSRAGAFAFAHNSTYIVYSQPPSMSTDSSVFKRLRPRADGYLYYIQKIARNQDEIVVQELTKAEQIPLRARGEMPIIRNGQPVLKNRKEHRYELFP